MKHNNSYYDKDCIIRQAGLAMCYVLSEQEEGNA